MKQKTNPFKAAPKREQIKTAEPKNQSAVQYTYFVSYFFGDEEGHTGFGNHNGIVTDAPINAARVREIEDALRADTKMPHITLLNWILLDISEGK